MPLNMLVCNYLLHFYMKTLLNMTAAVSSQVGSMQSFLINVWFFFHIYHHRLHFQLTTLVGQPSGTGSNIIFCTLAAAEKESDWFWPQIRQNQFWPYRFSFMLTSASPPRSWMSGCSQLLRSCLLMFIHVCVMGTFIGFSFGGTWGTCSSCSYVQCYIRSLSTLLAIV